MEVVRDGKLGNPDNWKTEISCEKKDKYDKDGCNATLAITEKDLFLMYFEGSHWNHHYTAVKCPQCGKYNRVLDVPKPIIERTFTPENKRKSIFDGFSDR